MFITQDVFHKDTQSNAVIFKLKTHLPSHDPCHRQPLTQQFSMNDGPSVAVDINVCSGSCFSVNVPSNNTFVKSLCRTCQESSHAFEQIFYPLKNGNFTMVQIKTALECKCNACDIDV